MRHWLASFLLAGLFVFLLQRLGIVARSKDAIAVSMDSLGTIGDADLSDEAKEARLRKSSLALFKLAAVLLVGAAAALAITAGVAYLAALTGVVSFPALIEVASSMWFLLACLAIAVTVIPILSARSRSRATSGYSAQDRALHRLAFSTTATQVQLAGFESRRRAPKLAGLDIDRPVFITGLPRSGTTLALTCLAQVPGLVSHSYRDMPFVLVPCFWDRFSRRFRKEGQERERAHGDGMMIDFDSPEALEEVVWMPFWSEQYKDDRIVPWPDRAEDGGAFEAFFKGHLRKILLVRAGELAARARYVSKNNLNIARIGLLRGLFPKAAIIVPFRDPVQHAASLARQHESFWRIHEEDAFAVEYMRGIGHFDFGKLLRPIDFDGWLDRRETRDMTSLSFWVEYWTFCYRHLLEKHRDQVTFVDYDALCADPSRGLERLAQSAGVDPSAIPDELAKSIRRPRVHDVATSDIPAPILTAAQEIHEALCGQSGSHRLGQQELAGGAGSAPPTTERA